ncbi:MAG: hypothetical protein WCD69_13645 [Xanthobacteraceae bacterium]
MIADFDLYFGGPCLFCRAYDAGGIGLNDLSRAARHGHLTYASDCSQELLAGRFKK